MAEDYKFIRAYSAAEDKIVVLKRKAPILPKGVRVFNTEEEALNG